MKKLLVILLGFILCTTTKVYAPQQPTAEPEIVSQPVKQQKKQIDLFSLLLDFMPVVFVGAVLFAVRRKRRRQRPQG